MIKLFAPKQLQLTVDQYVRSTIRDIKQQSAIRDRSFLIQVNGEKSFQNFHENRLTEKPFYNLSQLTLLRNFRDPLGKYAAYSLYLVSESVEIIHEMQYVDDPDDYLDIDNPYRGFESISEKTESTDQPEQLAENSENE